jgi:hypothetical protein
MRRVLGPEIFKTIVLPRLQGLNSLTQITGDDPKAIQSLLLQNSDPIKQWLNPLELLAR